MTDDLENTVQGVDETVNSAQNFLRNAQRV